MWLRFATCDVGACINSSCWSNHPCLKSVAGSTRRPLRSEVNADTLRRSAPVSLPTGDGRREGVLAPFRRCYVAKKVHAANFRGPSQVLAGRLRFYISLSGGRLLTIEQRDQRSVPSDFVGQPAFDPTGDHLRQFGVLAGRNDDEIRLDSFRPRLFLQLQVA